MKAISICKFIFFDLLLFASASLFVYCYCGFTFITSTCKRFLINKKKIILLKCFGVPLKKNDTLQPTGIYKTVMQGGKEDFNSWCFNHFYNKK